MILNNTVDPTEGELSVKSYHCTSFNSWLFGLKADGFLEVTNKRLLFQAKGNGIKGNSIIHSEVPIAEIVGINIFKGISLSIIRVILGILLFNITTAIVAVITGFLLSFLNEHAGIQEVLVWVIAIGIIYYAFQQTDNLVLHVMLIAVAMGVLCVLLKDSAMFYGSYKTSKLVYIVAIAGLIYGVFKFARRPAFSLFVHSKSASNSIVKITGPSPMGPMNSMASKALAARPAKDSELVLKELGAMIFDIQNLGEYGISKWKLPVK